MPNAVPPSLRLWLEGARDWSETDLGDPSTWPPELLSTVALSVPLGPVVVLWGPTYLRVYGPDYAPILGDKHPAALGMPATESWSSEQWLQVEPYLKEVNETGDVVHAQTSLDMDRSGFPERIYLELTYTPVRTHEGGEVLGIATTARDRTSEVLSEQRSDTLAEMGAVSVENRSERSVARRTITAAMTAQSDILALALVPLDGKRGSWSTPGTGRDTSERSVEPWPDGFPTLVETVQACLERGCIQPAEGCRYRTLDEPFPTEATVAERAIRSWTDGEQAAGECHKLPGKSGADDVGRMVVAMNGMTRQDDRQRVFLIHLADLAARALRDVRAEIVERAKVEGLEAALESNRKIGAAMGVLMALRRITPNEAFEQLRVASQNSNRKLRDVAEDVLRTGTLP